MKRHAIAFAFGLSALFVGSGLELVEPTKVHAQDAIDNLEKNLDSELDRIQGRIVKKPERMWIYAYEILTHADRHKKDLGRLQEMVREKYLEHDNENVRIVGAHVLLTTGTEDQTGPIDVLVEILGETESSASMAAVAGMLTLHEIESDEKADEAAEALLSAAENADDFDAEARVVLQEARAWFAEEDSDIAEVTSVLKGYLGSEDRDLNARAALALARMDKLTEVRARIESLSRESGNLALTARSMLDTRATLLDAMSTKTKELKPDNLTQEVIRTAYTNAHRDKLIYGQEERELSIGELIDNAGRGMAGPASLDPFSSFLTIEERIKQEERADNSYAGIGAFVAKRDWDEAIRVTQPIYSGPAYEAGLRSGDFIWEAQVGDGERVSMVGWELEDGIKLLKGPEGTQVKIWVKRPGVKDLVELTLTRARVKTDPAIEEMLPGKVGYIRLSQFGTFNTTFNMVESLENLRKEGATSIMLDLRGNPGGSLLTVVQLASLFLPDRAQVAMTEYVSSLNQRPSNYFAGAFLHYAFTATRPRERFWWEYWAQNYGDNWRTVQKQWHTTLVKDLLPFLQRVPLTVLTDSDSASGSELLSGTLQANKRARVVGETTFGKGIGQNFFPVHEANMDAEKKRKDGRVLKITTFAYYIMPGKSNIDKHIGDGGVKPDYPVSVPQLSSWEFDQVQTLRRGEKIDTWVRENWATHAETWRKLADYDGYTHTSYPEFDKLYASLETELSHDRIRRELRNTIRTLVADERAVQFPTNFQDDVQLQKALKVLDMEAALNLKSVEEYKPFMDDK